MAIDRLTIQTTSNTNTLILFEHSEYIVAGIMRKDDLYCISQKQGSAEFPLNSNIEGLKTFLHYNFVLDD